MIPDHTGGTRTRMYGAQKKSHRRSLSPSPSPLLPRRSLRHCVHNPIEGATRLAVGRTTSSSKQHYNHSLFQSQNPRQFKRRTGTVNVQCRRCSYRSHEWDQNEDVQCSEEDSSTLTSVPFPCVSPPFSPTLGPQCSRSRSNSFGWRADDIAAAFTIDEVPSEVAAARSGDTTASSPVPILFLSCYSPSPDHNSKPPLRTSSFSASSASTAAPDSRPTSLPLALDPPSRDTSRRWWQKIHPKKRVKKALAAMRASHHDSANNNLTPVNGGPGSDSRLPHEENHRPPGNASMQAVRAKSGPRRVPSKALSFLSTTSRSSGKSSATSTTVAAHVVPPGSLPAVDARQLPCACPRAVLGRFVPSGIRVTVRIGTTIPARGV
ncbi:hypothetical protein C8Q80DRAFT_252141 [Daedaleopsis nitida]|nr:hypothetical protein C8Q80DRAFT_252141 [Daedaleopsis nitida]